MTWVRNSGGAVLVPSTGIAPYSIYPNFDKAVVPWHVASGAWGPQRAVPEVASPVTTTEVTVTTWTDFLTHMLLGSRIINVTANINGAGAVIDGDVIDVWVKIASGVTLRSFNIGSYLSGQVATRLWITGPTQNVHSGGTLHNVNWSANPTDVLLDGIDITGPGVEPNPSPPPDWTQQSAIQIGAGAEGRRFAINKCRVMAGNYGFIGVVADMICTATSFYTGAEPRFSSGTEAWNIRLVGAPGDSDSYFYDCDFRGTRYHKLRVHPNGTDGRVFIKNCYFVDMYEARLMTVNQDMVTAPKGYLRALIAEDIECWTDLGDPPGGPDFSSNSAAYVRFTRITMHSDELTSNTSLGISDVGGSTGLPNIAIPDGEEDWVKDPANVFLPMAAAPSYKSTTPGSPEGLTWDIGA